MRNKMKEKQKWLLLKEDNGWQIVMPDPDIKPHGFPKNGKAELAGLECPCKPKINYLDKMIVHNSFEQLEKINEAIEKIK